MSKTFTQRILAINEARERVAAGEDPEEILMDEFRLEPDWVIDLITY